jgi:O-antigen/teichoic acid export membrane protein
MVNGPLWGAYADAKAKGDVGFIRHTLKISMLGTLGVSLSGALILFLGSQRLLQYWTAGAVEAPVALMGAMAVWAVLESCGAAFAMFLNGVHLIRQQVVVVVLFCAFVLPLKIVGIHQVGLIAIPLAAVLVYATTHLYFYGLVYYSRIRSIVTTAGQKT